MANGTILVSRSIVSGRENLGNSAHRLVQMKDAIIGGHNTGRFLTAMLERIQSQISQLGRAGMLENAKTPHLSCTIVSNIASPSEGNLRKVQVYRLSSLCQ